MITKEEKELRAKRVRKINELTKMYKIKTSELAKVTGLTDVYISQMKSGSVAITLNNFNKLVDGIYSIAKEYSDKPDIETENFAYVKQQLIQHDNVFVNKKKVKDIENYLVDLKINGFDCSYREVEDGYIITNNRVNKPMVEVVIKPKTFIEQDLSIIDKVRNMHENALQLHEEAVVIQETTEQILNEVNNDLDEQSFNPIDFMNKPTIEKKVDAFPAYAESLLMQITEDDINEALNQSSHYELPKDEEEELKVLSDQLLEKNGIKDKSDKQSFIEFIKLKFTDEELKGFVRGMTILSVFDDEYKDAAFYIEYYMRSWMDERAFKGV